MIVLIHFTVHLKDESTLKREASYFWMVPVALSMTLMSGSADRLMRTPHAEKHTSGVLESKRVTTYCSTETQKTNTNVSHWGFGDRKSGRESVFTPLCCKMKCLTSLICDRFPNTRVASKTASILELSKSFRSTAMTEGQAGGGHYWSTKTDATYRLCSHTHTHTHTHTHSSYTVRCVCAGNGPLSSRLGRKTGCWWWPRH